VPRSGRRREQKNAPDIEWGPASRPKKEDNWCMRLPVVWIYQMAAGGGRKGELN